MTFSRIIIIGAIVLFSIIGIAPLFKKSKNNHDIDIKHSKPTEIVFQDKKEKVKLNVVYIPQNDTKSCATTSVAMIISYYKNLSKPLDKEIVWKISGSDEKTIKTLGNDMEGLKRIAIYYGFQSRYLEYMKIKDIEAFLSKGIPVMINVSDGEDNHALLVVGYDKNKKIFYINDPAEIQDKIVKYSFLKSHWYADLSAPRGLSNQSGFVILPNNWKIS